MIDPSLPELPPLPATTYVLATEGDEYSEDRIWSWSGYDDDTMHAYATAYGAQCCRIALERAAQVVDQAPNGTLRSATAAAIRALALQEDEVTQDEYGEINQGRRGPPHPAFNIPPQPAACPTCKGRKMIHEQDQRFAGRQNHYLCRTCRGTGKESA